MVLLNKVSGKPVRVFGKILFLLVIFCATTTLAKDQSTGKASWYSRRCNHGFVTASGERLNDRAMTAAHKSFPFGTLVKVINLESGETIVVRINDRGPYRRGRVIDLTKGAFAQLAPVKKGVIKVRVEVVHWAQSLLNWLADVITPYRDSLLFIKPKQNLICLNPETKNQRRQKDAKS